MRILYVHGYNGSAEGSSYSLLKKHLGKESKIIGIDYCQDDCGEALKQIRHTIENNCIDVVIGCSLGGFLTILTQGIERYAINPCYRPSIELPKLGPQNNLPAPTAAMVSSYARFESKLKHLDQSDKQRLHVLIGDHDELLGDRYFDEIADDLGCNLKMIFSSHHLSDSAAATICALLYKSENMLDDAHKYSMANEKLISRSSRCGCFSCGAIFPREEIEDWTIDKFGKTAVCPRCFTDSVLPDSCPYHITPIFLKKMHKKWF